MSSSREDIQKQLLSSIPARLRDRFTEASSSKVLDVSNCGIMDHYLSQYIIPFLNANPKITTLNVSNNQIKDAGATAFARNQTLTTLHMGYYNQIGVAGRHALSNANQFRMNCYDKNKISFLSIMTLTNTSKLEPKKKVQEEMALNLKKRNTLFFQFRLGINGNRLDNNLIKMILNYTKPKPCTIYNVRLVLLKDTDSFQ